MKHVMNPMDHDRPGFRAQIQDAFHPQQIRPVRATQQGQPGRDGVPRQWFGECEAKCLDPVPVRVTRMVVMMGVFRAPMPVKLGFLVQPAANIGGFRRRIEQRRAK